MNESTKWGRGCLYHKLISEAAFQFGIRFTDKSLSDLFDLIFLINGKVISLHKVIKYVNRDKVFSTISVQNIRLVNLKPSCICTMSLISPWKGTWPFLWTNLNPPSGADPGILVRGGVDFFFKGMGFGARLKALSGSRATPRGWSPRKLLNFSDFRSKI